MVDSKSSQPVILPYPTIIIAITVIVGIILVAVAIGLIMKFGRKGKRREKETEVNMNNVQETVGKTIKKQPSILSIENMFIIKYSDLIIKRKIGEGIVLQIFYDSLNL